MWYFGKTDSICGPVSHFSRRYESRVLDDALAAPSVGDEELIASSTLPNELQNAMARVNDWLHCASLECRTMRLLLLQKLGST